MHLKIEGQINNIEPEDNKQDHQVTEMKDGQLSKILENIKSSIADFDSCKCPAVKYDNDDDADDVNDDDYDDYDDDGDDNHDDDDDDKISGDNCAIFCRF